MKITRVLISIFFFFLLCNAVIAQNFMHSVGVSFIRGKSKGTPENADITQKIGLTGITYFPRLLVVKGQETSISIGIPLTLGMIGNDDATTSGLTFGMHAPLVFDYNFGHYSTYASKQPFGGYVGAGLGFHYSSLSETSSFGTYSPRVTSLGPLVRGGIRYGFRALKEDWNFSFGGYFQLGLEKDKFKSGGVSLLIDLLQPPPVSARARKN